MGGSGYGVSNVTSMAQFTLGTIIVFSVICFGLHLFFVSRQTFISAEDAQRNSSASFKRFIIPLIIAVVIAVIVPIAVVGTSIDLQRDLLSTGVTEFVRFPWSHILPAQGWLTESDTIQSKAWMVTLLLNGFLGFLFYLISCGIFLVATKILRR